MGVEPGEFGDIDFRVKLPGKPANSYGVAVRSNSESQMWPAQPHRSLDGFAWRDGIFEYMACEFCDDVLAETADVTVGDAWLPQYWGRPGGTNILITRHSAIQALLNEGFQTNAIQLDPLSMDQIVASQDAGLRHRRDGLVLRLYDRKRLGKWFSEKRVQPGVQHLDLRYSLIFRLRERLRKVSHAAFPAAVMSRDLGIFSRRMRPWTELHHLAYAEPGKVSLKRLLKIAQYFVISGIVCLRFISRARRPAGSR